MSNPEDRVARLVRIWRQLNAPVSWALGIGLLVYATATPAGARQPEWWGLVGGLLGFPVISLWGQKLRDRKDDED